MEERRVENSSGIEIRSTYGPEDARTAGVPDPGSPGRFPFTRGVYETMYRGRLWTMRQYAGFGTAEQTNQRFRFLLESGQTGLSVAFDLPTQMGYDSDHPMAAGEVGRVGVAVDTVDDLAIVFDGIDLSRVSTSMTINATAAILLAMYVALADERGVGREQLAGTVQNDILKEFIARGTYVYPVQPSLRLVTDIFEYCAAELPRWNSISISGYHMREAGCTAVQEVAFTLANGLEYVEQAVAHGLDVEVFAPRLSFFFAAHNDLFEEVAKFRAARRLWARLMRERYDASDRACQLRFHTQTAGSTLTAQQPLNNVVRVAYQALAAVLGGTQSLHTNSLDETLALPTEDAVRIALRTQQILAYETGVANVIDPLGGSYYVEGLTDRMEREAEELFAEIERIGGVVRGIESGWFQRQIHQSSMQFQHEVEQHRRVIVGVNEFIDTEGEDIEILKVSDEPAEHQRRRLATLRAKRDAEHVRRCLAQLRGAAERDANVIPPMLDCARAYCTLYEIRHALEEVYGAYREPVFF